MTCLDPRLSQSARVADLVDRGLQPVPHESVYDGVSVAAMFLGTMDGAEPDTWDETLSWAKNLQAAAEAQRDDEEARHFQPTHALTSSAGALVLLAREDGALACLFASQDPANFWRFAAGRDGRLVVEGPRRWFWDQTRESELITSALEPEAAVLMAEGPPYFLAATLSTRSVPEGPAP